MDKEKIEEAKEVVKYFNDNGYAMLEIKNGNRIKTNLRLKYSIETLLQYIDELEKSCKDCCIRDELDEYVDRFDRIEEIIKERNVN